jgi:hypothetical protein
MSYRYRGADGKPRDVKRHPGQKQVAVRFHPRALASLDALVKAANAAAGWERETRSSIIVGLVEAGDRARLTTRGSRASDAAIAGSDVGEAE